MSTVILNLKLYVVRSSKDGKFFRAKGYGNSRPSWVESINDAKIYTKLGQARSRVTWFAREWPEYGTPEIIQIEAGEGIILESEAPRVKKALERIALKDVKRKQRYAQHVLEKAKRDMVEAESKIRKIKEEFKSL